MTVIGEAFVAIRPDASNFARDTDRELSRQSGRFENSGRDAGSAAGKGMTRGLADQGPELERAGTDVGGRAGKGVGDGLNKGVAPGLKTLAVGIGAVFVGMQIKDTIDAGSDLNETLSKTEVVFGKMSPAVIKWGDDAASSFGLSKQAALESVSTFGNLFQSMGVGGLVSAVMSENIVQLAADLGSFNNVGTDEALESIRSGLVGEAEPLRKFGVNINEASIQAKALELGLVSGQGAIEDVTKAQVAAEKAQVAYAKAVQKNGAESIEAREAAVKQEAAESKLAEAVQGKVPALNAAQKAQAVYNLILDQTALAQGDFSRTSDGAANQQKILQARVADLRAEIGLQLLPVYQKVLEIGGQIITYFKEHGDQAKALAIIVGTVLVGAFAAWAFSAIAAAAATAVAMAPVLLAVAAIGVAIYDGVELWNRYGDSIVEFLQPAIDIVETMYGVVKDTLDLLGLLDDSSGDGFNASGGVGDKPYGPYLQGGFYPQYHPTTDLSYLNDPNNPLWRYLGGRASGGSVWGPGTWRVGENGAEMLTLGAGQKGHVTPNGSTPNGSTGGIVVHVTTAERITDTTRFAIDLSHKLRMTETLVKL